MAVSLAAHALIQLLKSVSAEPGIDRDLTAEDLLRRADQQLYRAKSNGRDRVEPHEVGAVSTG